VQKATVPINNVLISRAVRAVGSSTPVLGRVRISVLSDVAACVELKGGLSTNMPATDKKRAKSRTHAPMLRWCSSRGAKRNDTD
jgi:hypothetical protein